MHGIEFTSTADPKNEPMTPGQLWPSNGIVSTTIAFRPPSTVPSARTRLTSIDTREDLASVDVLGTLSYSRTRSDIEFETDQSRWPPPTDLQTSSGSDKKLESVYDDGRELRSSNDKASVYSSAVSIPVMEGDHEPPPDDIEAARGELSSHSSISRTNLSMHFP